MLILTIMFTIIGIIEIIFATNWDSPNGEPAFLLSSGLTLLFVVALISVVMSLLENNEINPIEVYRGNTTLQITYQDSIPVDSVVVWKNK